MISSYLVANEETWKRGIVLSFASALLQALVAEIQSRKVQVFASVKGGNQLGLADELQKLGFAHECTAKSGWGDLYKWQPAPPSN